METLSDEVSTIRQPCSCELVTDVSRNTIKTCEAICLPYEQAHEVDDGRQTEIVLEMDPCPRIDPGGLLLLLNAARRDPSVRLSSTLR